MFPHLGMRASLSYQVFLPQECFQSEKRADLTLNSFSLRKSPAEDFSLLLKTSPSQRQEDVSCLPRKHNYQA